VLQVGQTPLYYAARNDHRFQNNSLGILVDAGATVDIIDKVS